MDDADVAGFVASLARPGGNITGLSFQTGEVSGKLLDLLKECRPKISRLAVLYVGEALRHGLREFEYIDGQNAVFAYRYADCNVERLPQLASELVKLRRNVISDPVWAQRSQDGAAGVCRQDPRGRKPADLPVQHLNSSLTARRQNKLV
jgi:hypothetical protein